MRVPRKQTLEAIRHAARVPAADVAVRRSRGRRVAAPRAHGGPNVGVCDGRGQPPPGDYEHGASRPQVVAALAQRELGRRACCVRQRSEERERERKRKEKKRKQRRVNMRVLP